MPCEAHVTILFGHIAAQYTVKPQYTANPVFARFKFHSRFQGSSETAEKFITDLRILAQDCDFKDTTK